MILTHSFPISWFKKISGQGTEVKLLDIYDLLESM